MDVLTLVFVLLAGSVVMLVVSRLLRLPSMLGYLVLGCLIGPHVGGLIGNSTEALHISELGVMALMFTLGLKFSLARLIESRRLVFGLGSAQVALCMALVAGIAYLLGNGMRDALIIAAVLTMSSTAVVTKLLLERGELSTPHGIRTVSVLILQDLAVILLLAVFGHQPSDGMGYAADLLKAGVVLVVLLVVTPRVMPRLVNQVARQQSGELFTLFVLAMVVGLSLLTYLGGLSAVLGAFIAGILLAESRHRYMIEEIIRPFREIFLGFFFISIGLLIDPAAMYANLGHILVLSLVVLLVKPAVIFVLAKLFGSHNWTAIHTGVALGGTGEFGFVLLTAAALSDDFLLQLLLGANLVCMVAPPLLIPLVERARDRLSNDEWNLQARDLMRAAAVGHKEDHVIICGYGQGAKVITAMLDRHGIAWVAIESNHEIYKAAGGEEQPNVVFADARHESVLIAVGIMAARGLVITHEIASAAIQTIHHARKLTDGLTILAKVASVNEAGDISGAGASFLSSATQETGMAMAAKLLQESGVSNTDIVTSVREVHRKEMVVSISDMIAADEGFYTVREVPVADNMGAVGMRPAELDETMRSTDVVLLAILRDGERLDYASAATVAAGDHLYLRGTTVDLDTAETVLTAPPQDED